MGLRAPEQYRGFVIKHCGHQTASWPYYLLPPSDFHIEGVELKADHRIVVVSHNGLGFQTAKAARSVVDDVVEGRATITIENCVQDLARVKDRDAMGVPR